MIVRKLMLLAVISVVLILTPSSISVALTIEFGTISGTVWEDSNQNGILEISEVGIDNVTVNVQNRETGEEYTTLTVNGGGFVFSDLASGNYRVWYEYEGVTGETETHIDELNGFVTADFGISGLLETSENRTNKPVTYTIYLPIIQQ